MCGVASFFLLLDFCAFIGHASIVRWNLLTTDFNDTIWMTRRETKWHCFDVWVTSLLLRLSCVCSGVILFKQIEMMWHFDASAYFFLSSPCFFFIHWACFNCQVESVNNRFQRYNLDDTKRNKVVTF